VLSLSRGVRWDVRRRALGGVFSGIIRSPPPPLNVNAPPPPWCRRAAAKGPRRARPPAARATHPGLARADPAPGHRSAGSCVPGQRGAAPVAARHAAPARSFDPWAPTRPHPGPSMRAVRRMGPPREQRGARGLLCAWAACRGTVSRAGADLRGRASESGQTPGSRRTTRMREKSLASFRHLETHRTVWCDEAREARDFKRPSPRLDICKLTAPAPAHFPQPASSLPIRR
jgi:hypothetical protein